MTAEPISFRLLPPPTRVPEPPPRPERATVELKVDGAPVTVP